MVFKLVFLLYFAFYRVQNFLPIKFPILGVDIFCNLKAKYACFYCRCFSSRTGYFATIFFLGYIQLPFFGKMLSGFLFPFKALMFQNYVSCL